MATQKEIQAAAKKAKKDIKASIKKEEEVKVEKSKKSLETLKPPTPPKIEEPTPEIVEKISKEDSIAAERKKLADEIKKEKKKAYKEEWDVKIGEEVNYFDPNLSYEITKYRPITMSKGLDFDPTPFTETGRMFEETGSYFTIKTGKLAYDFWKLQLERCTNGCTIGKYTITGDHYFFLNFYRLLNVSKITKAAEGRLESFPDFYSKQYEYFHYIELCERLGYDVVALKSRGVKSCPPLWKLRGN